MVSSLMWKYHTHYFSTLLSYFVDYQLMVHMLTDLRLSPEVYNQLRVLQKKAKELRTDVRNLRKTSQANALTMKEILRDTVNKIT